ncbi:MAG: class I SAM-dependent methyltransferase [Verrucomicrobiota bacterium]
MRQLIPELLDQLPANDPAAVHSRHDLRRINWFMRNAATIAAAARQHWSGPPPKRLVDLGAGDGALAHALEKRLAQHWPDLAVTLVDRAAIESPRMEFIRADAAEWLNTVRPASVDVLIANLFLHHFSDAELRPLLAGIARVTRLFVACEPRRSRRALAGCRLLGVIGCNHVTRHDARVSVAAGFAGRELSALWPTGPEWQLVERPAGLFSHLFIARRLA